MKNTEKVNYEKIYKLARENEKMLRRQEKQQQIQNKKQTPLENMPPNKNNRRQYKEDLKEKKKIICAIDSTPCNGRCREKNEINGDVQCGEAIVVNKKKKFIQYDF